MALDLTGITNENEFYTHHYLTAILENDLKGLFGQWEDRQAQSGERPPYDGLARLHKSYFVLRNQMERFRKPEEILGAQREFLPEVLSVLGYDFCPDLKELDSGATVPAIAEVRKKNGAADLWIFETISSAIENTDPLESSFVPGQYGSIETDRMLLDVSLTEIITKQVFTLEEPPRWIILLSFSHLVLLDRSKWNERRFLRFDLAEIFSRRVPATLRAMSALLHRESICPEDGISLLDTLDESSHKHAFAVSEDLKYSAREAVEILGNEALYYIRNVRKEGIYGKDMADQLTRECLRYLYRLLFLFYIEARPELGYAPMNSEEYLAGYSLEHLRDLELQPLTEEPSQNGYFIHDSLQTLFRLIFEGFNYENKTAALAFGEQRPVFRLFPLNSHLFDPARTPLLDGIKFRNVVLQKVIELLSLSREGGGKKRRGRISYDQLGINQLGAVYEGLLSYSGFFAETDLYEVKKAGTEVNELEPAFFVIAEDFQQYEEGERVFNKDGTHRIYPRGTFIYRLAGRNREKTASYYTPEVLTRCLVKYALKELLKDKTADDILKLTVCEPAMGSASFLNEAINQMAEAYLERKQKESGTTIGPDAYGREKQKVKAFIADNNVFGVDLNPTAVELAEVSLWLNAMYVQDDGSPPVIPWFGNQLICGNSLVGARRQVFASELLEENRKGKETWLDVVPQRVPIGKSRPPKTIYHFLLPDSGMADYKDKVVRGMAKKEMEKIKRWRRDFIRPFKTGEIETLLRLSDAVDKLWQRHTADCARIRSQTRSAYKFFGYDDCNIYKQTLTTKQKDDLYSRELLSENIPNSSPFRRLKLIMDYWCALWFWPIQEADKLPSRDEFLMDLSLILEGTVYEARPAPGEQMALIPDNRPKQQELDFSNEFGYVNVDALCDKKDGIERLALVRDLAAKHHFHHWELVFADIFAGRGGFDLSVGNPPWIKIEWNEGGILGDYDPLLVVRSTSASKLADLRETVIEKRGIRCEYIDEYVGFEGMQNFLNARQNYPHLEGMKANLYKCFLPQSWMIGRDKGVAAFLHPEGIYDDPHGGALRQALYPRLRYHFQFQNEARLFPIAPVNQYGINVYGSPRSSVQFESISNLFIPATIFACYQHDGHGVVPGIKTNENKLETLGHADRIICITPRELLLFAELYDDEGTPTLQARHPTIHSRQLISVLKKFALHPLRLQELDIEYFATQHWNEVNAQQDGTIHHDTQFPREMGKWILSGPHFHIGNPFFKTPRRVSKQKEDYDVLDHTILPDNYIPRTNYAPACDFIEYSRRTPCVPWGDNKPITEFFRVVSREMLSRTGERTFIPTIIPKHVSHIHTCIALCFADTHKLLDCCSLAFSLPVDFWVKSTGMGHANLSLIKRLPLLPEKSPLRVALHARVLMMTCLTSHYADLWEECWQDGFSQECWTKEDQRLNSSRFSRIAREWKGNGLLRTDYERHQGLLEIDVLAAIVLGMTLDELKTVYRVQFNVLRNIEENTWYDQKGRVVFIKKKGFAGVGFSSPEWEKIKNMKSGTVSRNTIDDTLPGGPRERTITYTAPFDRCDREADYATAWAAFEKRGLK